MTFVIIKAASFVVSLRAKPEAEVEGLDIHFENANGLNNAKQVSSARDLARMVGAAHEYPLIRQYSTRESATVQAFGRTLGFRNTNGLVSNPQWEIGLQKTGYIVEAGRCVVMQAQLAGRKLIMVLLDSAGKYSRMGDAERIRKWLASAPFVSAVMSTGKRAKVARAACRTWNSTSTARSPNVPSR